MRPTIKLKLAGAFAAVLALCAILGVVGVLKMSTVNDQSTIIAENWMPSIDAVHRINTATSDLRAQHYAHVASTDPADMAAVEKQLQETTDLIAQTRKTYEPLISSNEERGVYNTFARKYEEYLREADKALALSRQNKNQEAAAKLKESKALYDDMSNDAVRLVDLNVAGGKDASATGDKVFADSRALFIGVVALALIVGVAAALWISRTVTTGLRKISQAVEAVAIGDLNHEVSVTTDDEIKDLVTTVNQMTSNLRDTAGLADRIADGDLTVRPKPLSDKDTLGIALERMVDRLRGIVADAIAASDNVSSGSQELSATSEQMSQGATEQAAAAEQVSATME